MVFKELETNNQVFKQLLDLLIVKMQRKRSLDSEDDLWLH